MTSTFGTPLTDAAALRVNLLAHESGVPGRDVVESYLGVRRRTHRDRGEMSDVT